MTKDELISLARDRLDLMQHERFEDVIPIQLQILDAISQTDRIHDLASAWNYLSMLYYRVGRYVDAEHASLESIAVYQSEPNPSDEAIACYEMSLSTILAA